MNHRRGFVNCIGIVLSLLVYTEGATGVIASTSRVRGNLHTGQLRRDCFGWLRQPRNDSEVRHLDFESCDLSFTTAILSLRAP
jgi:hypothetical protein